MSATTLTMLTALSSAIIGGAIVLIGVYFTNRSNAARLKIQHEYESKQRSIELLRTRGEELYELMDKWLKMFAGYYLRRTSVMKGKLSYNDCLDLDIKDGKETTVNFGRISMLIDVYFPSARDAYDEINALREKINKIEGDYKRVYENGDVDGHRFIQPFINTQVSVEKAGDKFLGLISECIRTL